MFVFSLIAFIQKRFDITDTTNQVSGDTKYQTNHSLLGDWYYKPSTKENVCYEPLFARITGT